LGVSEVLAAFVTTVATMRSVMAQNGMSAIRVNCACRARRKPK
jgi:hypothetical protein